MTLHATSSYNVEATLTAWLTTQLGAVEKPSWMPAVTIVTDAPEIVATLPCISIFHIPGYRQKHFQGDASGATEKAMEAHGIMDVSCWVSRSQKWNNQEVWVARLRYLQTMVETVLITGSLVVVKDYLTSITAPADTPYRVVIGDVSLVQTAPDPNPDIERRRAIVNYAWTLRR